MLSQLRKAGGRTAESASVRVGGGYQRLGDYLKRMTEGVPGAAGSFDNWVDATEERQRARRPTKPSLAASLDGGIEPPALYPLLGGRASEQQAAWQALTVRSENQGADGGEKVTDRFVEDLLPYDAVPSDALVFSPVSRQLFHYTKGQARPPPRGPLSVRDEEDAPGDAMRQRIRPAPSPTSEGVWPPPRGSSNSARRAQSDVWARATGACCAQWRAP